MDPEPRKTVYPQDTERKDIRVSSLMFFFPPWRPGRGILVVIR